ncbi:hypothetical protein C0992_012782 [Termitomyces sp. T32_za158]|nr:hypothetical protein C0992_012782 [Termitomyces sp. T32_za158]
MSARQNKKQRKGRNNPNNRERTVTTLTEDPNSSYLIPLPSEDPPGALMSSPFSIASSAANGPSSSAYQPPSSYEAFGYTDFSSQPQVFSQQAQQQPQQQPQQQQVPQPPSIPGKNDFERLENLKNIIKANQHANYRPIAQPAALAALYLGPLPTSQSEPNANTNGSSQAISTTASSPSSPADNGRRPPRLQSKEWENPARGKPITVNGGQPTNNVLSDSSPISAHLLTSSSSFSFSTQTNSTIQSYGGRFSQGTNAPSAIDTSTTNIQGSAKINSAGPLSAELKSTDVHMADAQAEVPGSSARFESGAARTTSNAEPTRIPDETGYGAPRGPGITEKSTFDSKDDLRTPRDSSWTVRNGPPPDDRRRDLDRPVLSPRPALNGSGGGSDPRSNLSDRALVPRDPLPPRDDRFYDRERERDRERYERDRREWDRDRRSSYERFRPPPDVTRRPPPEQRHYEPEYSDRGPARRYDVVKEEPISDARRLADLRRPPSPVPDGRPPVRPEDDRLPLIARLPPSSGDSRAPPVDVSRPHLDPRAPVPPHRAPTPDNRPVRAAVFDSRHVKPATLPEERRGAPVPPEVRAPPPSSVRPADIPGATRPADRERERNVSLTPVDVTRPSIPLEERIGRPSLQERISNAQPDLLSQAPPPPASRPEPGRPLEERLSAIPVPADSREQRGRLPDRAERPPPPPPPSRPPQPIDERMASRPPPTPIQDDRRIDDRPGRYTRGMSPPGDRSAYPPSVREDPHSVNKGVPSPRSGVRDYRPISRERSASYRSDERNYISDDRRTDAMDVDTSSRYSDTRAIPYNRPFSPPSAADLARDRARTAAQYPPSPNRPPPPHDAHPYDDDRRYPPSSRDWAPSYHGDRRREWSTADEEYYKSRQWDRNPPPPPPPPAGSVLERERYEREPPPPPAVRNNGWETRDERERRDYPPPRAPSPPRPYDGHPRSLGSRLTDTYSAPAPGGAMSDRSFAPRDAPPPFSRVRQRSLSPPARRPGAPVIDETRPAKRTREDGYGAGEYYPPSTAPSARDPGAALRRPENYPALPRAVSPPAPSGAGGAYFDNRAPPPPASAPVSGGEREYPPREYPVQSYERQRSPPRGATYSRGGYSRDTRDDRRYPPPPPPPPAMLPPRRP